MDAVGYGHAGALNTAEIKLAERKNLVRYYKWRGRYEEWKRRLSLQMRPLRYVIRVEVYFGKTAKKKQQKLEVLTADVAILKHELMMLRTARTR